MPGGRPTGGSLVARHSSDAGKLGGRPLAAAAAPGGGGGDPPTTAGEPPRVPEKHTFEPTCQVDVLEVEVWSRGIAVSRENSAGGL